MGARGGPNRDLVRLPVPVTGEDTPVNHVNVFRGGTVIDIAWARLHGQGLRLRIRQADPGQDHGLGGPERFHPLAPRRRACREIRGDLQYGCGVTDAGSRIRIASGDARIEFVVEPTSAVDVWRTQGVGFLGLKPDSPLWISGSSPSPGKA